MENYKKLRKLGSGNFAKVYLAEYLPTHKKVALKLIDKKEVNSLQMFKRVHREMNNMKKLSSHPNIVSIIETFETSQYYVIAMEYLPGGELFEYVLEREGLVENVAKDMFTQILQAVEHCHKNGVMHRDLKLENILLDANNKPKIADFGLSKEIHPQAMLATYCGSPLYTSPEVILGRPYIGPECDVWSLGVILYTMLTATMPFDDSNFAKYMERVEKGEYPEPVAVTQTVKDLISRMLDPNPDTRITIQDILAHPWFTKFTPSKLRRRRFGVCLENSDNIRESLLRLNVCDCSCHKMESQRDSVVSKHCPDCDDFIANDPELMLRRQDRLSRNSSICSSGYGSDFGSLNQLPILPRNKHCFLDVSEERRCSIPRKSASSKQHRSSVPVNILQPNNSDVNITVSDEVENEEDEELVFV